jgi:histidyl-tRNA synthetase
MLTLYDRVFSDLKMNGITLKINHRKILTGIAGLLGEASELTSFTITLDKIDKIGKEGVIKELTSKGFSSKSISTLEHLLKLEGTATEQMQSLETLLADQQEGLEGITEMKFIISELEKTSLEAVTLSFDLTLARGLHYYTGMIVEVNAPEDVKMGSIGGGGRYDDLTDTFGLKNMSGIGISFGFERIYLVMEALELFPESLNSTADILFTNFGDAPVSVAYKFVNELRKHGIECELYPSEVKLKKQLAYANAKKMTKVVLIGSQELENKQFVLKNMDSGKQSAHSLSDLVKILS